MHELDVPVAQVEQVIRHVQRTVQSLHGVSLDTEVRIIGEGGVSEEPG